MITFIAPFHRILIYIHRLIFEISFLESLHSKQILSPYFNSSKTSSLLIMTDLLFLFLKSLSTIGLVFYLYTEIIFSFHKKCNANLLRCISLPSIRSELDSSFAYPFSSIAFFGHAPAQIPHSTHFSSSSFQIFSFLSTWIASCGHFFAQSVQ